MNRLDEIRKRHEATLFIDWEKEFDPEWQPQSLSNAELAHKDRGALLDMVKELEAQLARIAALKRKILISYADSYEDGVVTGWNDFHEELQAALKGAE